MKDGGVRQNCRYGKLRLLLTHRLASRFAGYCTMTAWPALDMCADSVAVAPGGQAMILHNGHEKSSCFNVGAIRKRIYGICTMHTSPTPRSFHHWFGSRLIGQGKFALICGKENGIILLQLQL
jgi:hypothetical protein